MIYDLITVGRGNMDLYTRDIGAEFKDVTRFDATVGEVEHLPSSETRALVLSANPFSRGPFVKAATFCTEAGHKAGLSTNMELDLRTSERLQPGGDGLPQ